MVASLHLHALWRDRIGGHMDNSSPLRLERDSRGGLDAILDQRRRVLGMIEAMDKPSIATLYGNCLGGGLELPLACHFRLAADSGAQIGLPELELGTVPAWLSSPVRASFSAPAAISAPLPHNRL